MGMLKFMIVVHWQPLIVLGKPVPCHERCKHMGIGNLLHIIVGIKLLDEVVSLMMPNALEN
jgi:hypothetical protein